MEVVVLGHHGNFFSQERNRVIITCMVRGLEEVNKLILETHHLSIVLFAIFTQGGKQYFDSGDYNRSKSRHDRQEIASHPHAMDPQAVNPHLAQLRGASISRTPKSKGKSPLAS